MLGTHFQSAYVRADIRRINYYHLEFVRAISKQVERSKYFREFPFLYLWNSDIFLHNFGLKSVRNYARPGARRYKVVKHIFTSIISFWQHFSPKSSSTTNELLCKQWKSPSRFVLLSQYAYKLFCPMNSRIIYLSSAGL